MHKYLSETNKISRRRAGVRATMGRYALYVAAGLGAGLLNGLLGAAGVGCAVTMAVFLLKNKARLEVIEKRFLINIGFFAFSILTLPSRVFLATLKFLYSGK